MLENRTEGVEMKSGLCPKGTVGAQGLTCIWTLGKVADRSPEIIALVIRGQPALLSCWTVILP